MTPAQLRAARALLDWTQAQLAEKANVGLNVVKSFEKGASDPRQSTVIALRKALARGGVELTEAGREHGPGVRLREPQR